MISRYKHIGLSVAAISLGLMSGSLTHSLFNDSGSSNAGDPASHPNTRLDRSRHNAHTSTTARFLWSETAALRDHDEFEERVTRLHRNSRSPLRAVSLLSYRVQDSSFEEWELLLAEGKVTRLEVLEELGAHLARTDPSRALKIALSGPHRFDNIEQALIFRHSVIRTVCDMNPELVLDSLKNMERGGSQLSFSKYFSEHWAENDPRAAVDHFDELVWLRNMPIRGVPQMTDQNFASLIMSSWISKDADEASAYVENLPVGPKRNALQAAFDALKTDTEPD